MGVNPKFTGRESGAKEGDDTGSTAGGAEPTVQGRGQLCRHFTNTAEEGALEP